MTFEGQLEIDEDRGVIYFHSNEGMTILRICSLPKPIPNPIKTTMLDITFGYGVSWNTDNYKQ